MGGDYIVAVRPHYSRPLTSQLMYTHTDQDPGITPYTPSQYFKVLISVLATLPGHNSAGT